MCLHRENAHTQRRITLIDLHTQEKMLHHATLSTRCCVAVAGASSNATTRTTTTLASTSYAHLRITRRSAGRTTGGVCCFADGAKDEEIFAWKRLQSEYTAWRVKNNILAPNVEVAYVGGSEKEKGGDDLYRGVKATSDIASEDDLVRLPREATMLVVEGQENPHEEYISNELWAKAGDERWALRVALVLLYEKSLGSRSKFYEYIEQLPKSFENLGTWTEEEVRELQYSVGEKFAKEQRLENEKACELIQEYARDGGLKTIERDEVIWALDVVRSRVFSGKIADQEALQRKLLPRALSVGTVFASFLTAQTTELKWLCVFALLALVVFDSTKENDVKTDTAYVLMPLIDAFNHQTMLKTEFEFTNSEFALKSPKSYKKGEEVLISYGLMPNDELLLRYGFVDDQNVADTYQFEGLLPYLTQNDPTLKENLEKNPKRIEALRFIPEGSLEDLTLEDSAWRGAFVSDGTAEPNLSWALRCLYATESEWINAGGSCDGFRLGGGQTEKKAALALKMACEYRLQEMETTYNQDQGLLKEKGGENWKMRQAILYRMRKKKILSDAVKRYSV